MYLAKCAWTFGATSRADGYLGSGMSPAVSHVCRVPGSDRPPDSDRRGIVLLYGELPHLTLGHELHDRQVFSGSFADRSCHVGGINAFVSRHIALQTGGRDAGE